MPAMIFSSDSKYPSRRTYGGAILPGRHTAEEGPNAQSWQSHARFTTRVSEHKFGEEVLA
jgi:hypothetical protein